MEVHLKEQKKRKLGADPSVSKTQEAQLEALKAKQAMALQMQAEIHAQQDTAIHQVTCETE